MKKLDLSSAISLACSLLVFIALSVSAQDISEDVSFKMRSESELSKFEDFSRDNGNDKDKIRTTTVWETELYNSDGYDNYNYAMFKYGDIIYVYGFYYDFYKDKSLHFRRFNALTGEPLREDDGSDISKIYVPTNQTNIGWPYESKDNIKTSVTGSWLRFFTDDNGEIGLVSFIRDANVTGHANYVRLAIGTLDIDRTFKDKELYFKRSPVYYDFDIEFLERENFVSELFNINGALEDNNLVFDFIVLKLSGRDEYGDVYYDKQWFHFDQSDSEEITSRKFKFSNETRTNDYDPYTICAVEGDHYIINSPYNGANLISPIDNSDGYEFSSAWLTSAGENVDGEETQGRVKNYCFVPINIAEEEYYITTGRFPVMSIPSTSTIDGERTASFSLKRWRDKSDFSNLNEIVSFPSDNAFEYNYYLMANGEQQYKMLATISQKCVVEYRYKAPATSAEVLTLKPKSQDKGEWMKTICYLYSPSAGIGRYEFEPVSDGSVTSLDGVFERDDIKIQHSGTKLWIDGERAPLKVYDVTGSVVFSSESCTEANIDSLIPGLYIVSWGSAVSKILVK